MSLGGSRHRTGSLRGGSRRCRCCRRLGGWWGLHYGGDDDRDRWCSTHIIVVVIDDLVIRLTADIVTDDATGVKGPKIV
jgi:hypothetical protein